MIHWTNCCFFVLGMTAFAMGRTTESVQSEEEIAPPTFGLQVQMGQDGNLNARSRQRSTGFGAESLPRNRGSISQARYSQMTEADNEASDAGRLKLAQFQEPDTVVNQDPRDVYFTDDDCDCREWQVLPQGLMYKAYLAGEKESRMSSVFTSIRGRDGVLWENTLGGHVGLLRYGNRSAINPEGWQLDLEGAAMPRVDMGHSDDLEAVDFRAGFLSTWRYGPNAYKAGYYHLSSHAGDEFLLRVPTYHRLNYVRDSFIVGWTRFLTPDAQAYGEVAYAWNAEDGAQPLEFQYGLQYSPMVFGFRGAPFAAINGHTRQDFGWITSVTVQAGWQWRGYTNHLWRFGVQYYKGPALQWEFAGQSQNSFGAGMWFDY